MGLDVRVLTSAVLMGLVSQAPAGVHPWDARARELGVAEALPPIALHCTRTAMDQVGSDAA